MGIFIDLRPPKLDESVDLSQCDANSPPKKRVIDQLTNRLIINDKIEENSDGMPST